MARGEVIAALAMTEPGAGSDVQAIRTTALRQGDELVVNGPKTFITNGQLADLVILACKTDACAGAKGVSLVLVETDRPGFKRGRSRRNWARRPRTPRSCSSRISACRPRTSWARRGGASNI